LLRFPSSRTGLPFNMRFAIRGNELRVTDTPRLSRGGDEARRLGRWPIDRSGTSGARIRWLTKNKR
jgi:hypothetical protein